MNPLIYHNPECGTSRNALANDQLIDAMVVLYVEVKK